MISFSEIPPAKVPLRIASLGHSVATNLNNYSYEPKNYLDDARQKLNAASIYEKEPLGHHSIQEKEKPADRYSVGFTRVWIPLRETESVGIRTLLLSHFFIVKC